MIIARQIIMETEELDAPPGWYVRGAHFDEELKKWRILLVLSIDEYKRLVKEKERLEGDDVEIEDIASFLDTNPSQPAS